MGKCIGVTTIELSTCWWTGESPRNGQEGLVLGTVPPRASLLPPVFLSELRINLIIYSQKQDIGSCDDDVKNSWIKLLLIDKRYAFNCQLSTRIFSQAIIFTGCLLPHAISLLFAELILAHTRDTLTIKHLEFSKISIWSTWSTEGTCKQQPHIVLV